MIITDNREAIQAALKSFDSQALDEAAFALFANLGYESNKRLRLKNSSVEAFKDQFPKAQELNPERALTGQWSGVHFLFQLTDDEVGNAIGFGQEDIFASSAQVDDQRIESYLFFAIDLKGKPDGNAYTRTELSNATRALNRIFPMPVMVLFRHGDTISLGIINRRIHKRDTSKDVLEKVTLVKDICYGDPLRAHIEILRDLSVGSLFDEYKFTNFVGLHHAWEKRLATYALNERFYREISDWYFAALQNPAVVMPRSIAEIKDDVERDKQRSLFFIRLLTRLIFCWFLQEKGLIPRDLFRERVMKYWLKNPSPDEGSYYKAFLQNLFFATLNQEQGKRQWRKKYDKSRDGNVGVTNLWRYADLLADNAGLEELLRTNVPFVNGGLFDCLDDQIAESKVFLDGFSERKDNPLHLPNALFFGKERLVDLSEVLQDKRRRKEKVSGLINILSRYKFTVEENTPLEEEIALDPELLGKVFENLLASFNEDTQTTARKALGAFYTPRSVVSYMVDEALCSYLGSSVPSVTSEKLSQLMKAQAPDYTAGDDFTEEERAELVRAIGSVRIIDHACGSGAYPMGALHRLVDLLQKLDPNNKSWKHDRLEATKAMAAELRLQGAKEEDIVQMEQRVDDIEKSFDSNFHELDYARKLYLIEECIYGVDIQPVAVQIAKLRFFIALVVDQKVRRSSPNLGVRPMPNLETKVVAANALIPIDLPQLDLFSAGQVDALRQELLTIRHEHFDARTPARKKKLRERDAGLRQEIATFLKDGGLPSKSAKALAQWDPYDQNGVSPFFDPSWMFGFKQDNALFDVVLANPPYVRQEKIKHLKDELKPHYPHTYKGTADLYVYFYERALQLLRPGGTFSFITSNKWFRSAYGENLRKHLGRTASLIHVIDFGDADVFTAIAYPTIVVGRKAKADEDHRFKSLNWDPEAPSSEIDNFAQYYLANATRMPQHELKPDGWRFIAAESHRLLERIKAAGVPLGQFVDKRFYYGIKTGLNEAFVIDRATRDRLIAVDSKSEELLKPFLRGRDVKRWRVDYQDLWLIFTRHGTDINNYKAIKRYLNQFRSDLEPKPADWPTGETWEGRKAGSYKWFEIQDNIAYWQEFQKPKILIPCIEQEASFAVDYAGYFSNDKTSFIVCDRPEALCAVLNSQLHWWYGSTCQHYPSKQGGFVEFKPTFMDDFPVPHDLKQEKGGMLQKIALFVQAATGFSNSGSASAKTLQSIADALVYELYFPQDLHEKGLRFFDLIAAENIPDINTIPGSERQATIKTLHARLSAPGHPIQTALQELRTIPAVRLIEGVV